MSSARRRRSPSRRRTGQQLKATLVGTFPADDLAVIKVVGLAGLRPAAFADSSKLRVGDIAMAIGNPLGLSSSVTQGIVSALGRSASEGNGVTLPNTIQTSAPINPGNSGGALAEHPGPRDRRFRRSPRATRSSAAPRPASASRSRATPSRTSPARSSRTARSSTRTAPTSASTSATPATASTSAASRPARPAAKAGLKAGDVIIAVDGQADADLGRARHRARRRTSRVRR